MGAMIKIDAGGRPDVPPYQEPFRALAAGTPKFPAVTRTGLTYHKITTMERELFEEGGTRNGQEDTVRYIYDRFVNGMCNC